MRYCLLITAEGKDYALDGYSWTSILSLARAAVCHGLQPRVVRSSAALAFHLDDAVLSRNQGGPS